MSTIHGIVTESERIAHWQARENIMPERLSG
jgi:hypothetical protein